jgi:uncharacterized membrane protein
MLIAQSPVAQKAVAAREAIDEVWRLETHWSWSPAITVIFVSGVIALVAWCYLRELSPAGRAYRIALGVLRLTTIALLMAMLSEAVLSGTRSGRPRLTVVVDRSESMRTIDQYPAEELPSDLQSGAPIDRLSLAATVLDRDNASLVSKLQETYDISLALADGETKFVSIALPAEIAPAIRQAAEPVASNSETRLGDSLSKVLSESNGPAPQVVVVLSDGQVTSGASLSSAAEIARRVATPLYIVGIGRDEAPPGAELEDLLADDAVFVNDLVQVQATLKPRGLAGQRVRVSLRRDGAAPLAEETFTLPDSDAPLPVRLSFRPTEQGSYALELNAVIEPEEGEPLTLAPLKHALTVHDSKLKVLVAAGYPNYEYRYLKSLLERDSSIELSVFLQEADFEYVEADAAALARFPVRAAELNDYDVIVLLDLDATLLPRSLWGDVRQFVSQRGGGLMLVCGPRYLPATYAGLADFAAISPFSVGQTTADASLTDPGFQVTPTELGALAPALQLADSPSDSAQVWRQLPPLYWYAELGKLKPGAQVLAEHPQATRSAGGAQPLIALQYVGAGRVLVHAMDATYRWRYRVGDTYFARYWIQTLRTLARGKLLASGSGVELAADRRQYEAGEAVRIELRVRDPQLLPDGARSVAALVEAPGRPQQTVELTAIAGETGVYRAQLTELPPGNYRVLLAESLGNKSPPAVNFQIARPAGELAKLGMNRAAMTSAAEQSRGAFFTLAEIDRLANAIPAGRRRPLESLPPVELWNRWPLLAGIVTCLVAEWILRKRKAML